MQHRIQGVVACIGRRTRWPAIAVSALIAFGLAGCGLQHSARGIATQHHSTKGTTTPTSTPNGTTATLSPEVNDQPTVAPSTKPVNGCRPSVFGFCVTTKPQFYCCSAAYTGWSGIYVGETVDVKGAVPLYTNGQSTAKDVYIVAPSGAHTVLTVNAEGGFSQTVRFSQQGKYLMGVDASGPGTLWSPGGGAQPLPFYVAFRAIPAAGERLSDIFPASSQSWRGITVLAAPLGADTTLRVRIVDASGNPAAAVRLPEWNGGGSIVTDVQGYAEIPYHSPDTGNYSLDELYTGFFVQTYSRLTISGDTLAGLPSARITGAPSGVRVIRSGGTPMVDVSDFLQAGVWQIFQSPPGSPPPISYDAATGILDLTALQNATLNTRTGAFVYSPPTQSISPGAHFVLKPVVVNGQVYLSLPDLAKILDIFSWAQPLPDGSMLFSMFQVP